MSLHRARVKRCPACQQPYFGKKGVKAPRPYGSKQRKRHRRKSTHVSELKSRKNMYKQNTLSRAKSAGALSLKKKNKHLSSKSSWLDFATARRSFTGKEENGMKGPKTSFASFANLLSSFTKNSENARSSQDSGSNTIRNEALADGTWETLFDETSGYYYRVNYNTGESQWITEEEEDFANDDDEVQLEEEDWPYDVDDPDVETRFDEDSGNFFQVNLSNGDSRWLQGNVNDLEFEDGEINLEHAEPNPLYRAEKNKDDDDTILTKSGKRIHRKTTVLSKEEGTKFLEDLLGSPTT